MSYVRSIVAYAEVAAPEVGMKRRTTGKIDNLTGLTQAERLLGHLVRAPKSELDAEER